MDTPPTSHDTSHSLNKPTIGVLLVHGLNGSRRDFAELELALQDRGMLTNNMLLPGHGTHIREVVSLGWQDWADAVRAELIALKQRCDVVFIVGHSLGGSLTLHIAAHEEVAGIFIIFAPPHMHPLIRLGGRVVKHFTPLVSTVREDGRGTGARPRVSREAC